MQAQQRDGRMTAVIVDEWAVLRSGVGAVLAQSGVDVLGQTADLAAAVRLVARASVDLVVLGHLTDVATGLGVRAFRATAPEVRVVVLLQRPTRHEALDLLDEGACGIVAREASEGELREAVMRAARGERYLAAELLALPSSAPATGDVDPLTDRERAVLRELSVGRSNRQIADALFIGEATVKTHLLRVFAKLGVDDRTRAVMVAVERGLLPNPGT
jgi:DNA-binding NarL/FixJ family response regulator